jgi:hypothetical protein
MQINTQVMVCQDTNHGEGFGLRKCVKGLFGAFSTFFLIKKWSKKSRTKEWLRPFVRPAHRCKLGRRSYYLSIGNEWGDGAGLRCVLCEDTGGAMLRLDFLKAIRGLKNGGIRQRADRRGAERFLFFEE